MKPLLVFVTASSQAEARKLADASLAAGLVACAQIVPGVESHYVWQGKKEVTAEWQIVFKTSAECWPKLETLLRKNHSYDTPEIIAVEAARVSEKYRKWWERELD